MTPPARSPGTGPDVDPHPEPTPAAVPSPSAGELVRSAVSAWRAALVEAAGGSALVDVDLLGDGPLDLSAAHPSGIAQLFAGRDTRLSNLVREGAALSTAKRRARAVGSRSDEYAQRYGVAPTYLAIGVATWTERSSPDVATDDVAALASAVRGRSVEDPEDGPAASSAVEPPSDAPPEAGPAAGPVAKPDAPPEPRTVRTPVLLRPVALLARGSGESDYELTLEPTIEVNPVLARALRARGALLDPGALARGAFTGSGFNPRPALDRLASLGAAVLEDFAIRERLLVGTFVHPGQVLVEDLDQQSATLDHHEVVAALAGDESARRAVARDLPAPVAGDRHPDQERGVGDLDPTQQHVLDVVAGGSHLFVDAPAGSDVPGTVAAVVADAAAAGRTVLYVPGHRRAAAALAARMRDLGLADLLLDVPPEPGWRAATSRRLMDAMRLQEQPVDTAGVAAVRSDLVVHRDRLRAYVTALHEVGKPWGASPYDALQALARLTAARPAPQTTVRLRPEVARALAPSDRRERLAADLVRAARLGAFTLRPTETPWFDADLITAPAAQDVVERIERLVSTGLPLVVERVREVAATTGLTPATSVGQWDDQLRMLHGIRGALDVFQPMIFERTAADLVAATATSAWRTEHGMPMGLLHRRRLRRQALDMVRPGRPVADLHGALVQVQEQREIWQAHCPAGGWPRLPDGLADMEDEFAVVRGDVDVVSRALATTPAGGALDALPFADLLDRLRRLLVDRRALDTLPERTAVTRALRDVGLDGLLQDLAHRRVAPGLVGAELELAWWSTVFEEQLRGDAALAGYDGAALTALVAGFRRLDLAHVASLSVPVRNTVVAHVMAALHGDREVAHALYVELAEGRLTSLRETVERYPDLVRRLRPVLTASPMLVPQVLPPTRTVDVVVLDAVQHLPLEVTLAALARGRQVVVVGDPRSASGSAVRELAAVLPRVGLRAGATRRDPHLTAFLVDHGYAGVLRASPLPHATPLVRLDVVDGSGMPDPVTGSVESTRAEVEHVVEAVITHALTRPEESLAVVSPSAVHAARIREAVLGEVRVNPALAAFFGADRAEPFVVTDLLGVGGLRREAVILSLGYGRTPHGRVLHRFEPLSGPGGEAMLLDALGATRHRLLVVSCFRAEDLDPERLRGPGSRLLADLLAFAAGRGSTTTPDGGGTRAAGPDATADRLVVDLADRLWRRGLTVQVGYGVAGGARIPLAVGHPDLPEELLVAVLTDDDAYVAEPSVRARDRQVPQRLEALGWTVVQVWSAAAFLDPEAEVDAIVRAVQERLAERSPASSVTGRVRVPESVPVDSGASGTVPPATGTAATAASAPPSEEPPVELGSEADDDEDTSHDVSDPGVSFAEQPAAHPGGGTGGARRATAQVDVDVDVEPAATPVLHDSPGTVGVPHAHTPGVVTARAVPGMSPAPGTAPGPTTPAPHPTPALPVPPGTSTQPGTPAPQAAPAPAAAPPGTPAGSAASSAPRPPVPPGLPVEEYGDDELDELARWILTDGVARDADDLAGALRAELGLTRRSARVDAAVGGAARRALA